MKGHDHRDWPARSVLGMTCMSILIVGLSCATYGLQIGADIQLVQMAVG
jgi:hypothetical protein